jgi:phage tail-like protein
VRTVSSVHGRPHLRGEGVDLEWVLPPAGDFAGNPLTAIRVVRRERTFPRQPDDGVTVYEGPPVSQLTDRGLATLRTHYYTVFTRQGIDPSVQYHADDGSQAAVFVTADYGSPRRLYELLPAVHQRLDEPLAPHEVARLRPDVAAAFAALAPALQRTGQLKRFMLALGAPFDLMRSFAEGLSQLHDADVVRPEFMAALAHFVGWELDRTLPVYSQRNEIKFAPRLYRGVGTVPCLRSIVTRYTGWTAQTSESAERILRANHPPELNIFAVARRGAEWRGADDAGAILGFGLTTNAASGSAGLPAKLVSPNAAPFALRPDMQLSVTVDDRLPVVTRLRPGDFDDIFHAQADELAAALNRTLTEATATAMPGGHVEVRSHTTGPDSLVRVDLYESSLVTLEGAPRGRIAAVRESADRSRILYEAFDPMASSRAMQAGDALSGRGFARPARPEHEIRGQARPAPLASVPGRARRSGIRMKVFRAGSWGDTIALPSGGGSPQRDPAVALLGGGMILAAWVEVPEDGSQPTIRYAQGSVRAPSPARVSGRRAEPFAVEPGSRLVVRGNWPEAVGFELPAGSLATPASATAAQVAAALNARLAPVRAVALADGTLALETKALGDGERIELDLEASTAAAALGFGDDNASARGDWGDEIDWTAFGSLAPPQAGDVADLSLAPDGAGGAWLAFSDHADSVWRVRLQRFTGAAWQPPVSEPVSEWGAGNREPTVAAVGTKVWVVWSQRIAPPSTSSFAWSLRRRVFDAGVANAWLAPEEALTTTPAPESPVADREPSMTLLPSGRLGVFFCADRTGSTDRWSVEIDPATGVADAPVHVAGGAFCDRAPTPLAIGPAADLWLVYRSDRSVPMAQVARTPIPAPDTRVTSAAPAAEPPGPLRSIRLDDAGTVRRFAGSTTANPRDTPRVSRRDRFDDPSAYTPQRLIPGQGEHDDDRYTRGTVVLYLNRIVADNPLTDRKRKRLEAVLARFLPINVRAVVVLAPRVDVDYFYEPADIGESYEDVYPFVEDAAPVVAEERVAVSLPEWILLAAAVPGPAPAGPPIEVHRSADPKDLTSLRERTFQSDLDPNRRWSNDGP